MEIITAHFDRLERNILDFINKTMSNDESNEHDSDLDENCPLPISLPMSIATALNPDSKIQYRSEYEYDFDQLVAFEVKPEVTLLGDYFDLVRSKAINELEKAKKEIMDSYQMNRHLYGPEIKEERMRRQLFKDKFCFCFNVESKNPLLTNYTIITDFYLNKSDLNLLT